MNVDLNPTPDLWQGAAIGIAAFALVAAAYPEIPLLSLTTGSLLAVVAVYLGTIALESSRDDEDGARVEATEAEEILVKTLDVVAPERLDEIADDDDRLSEIVEDLVYRREPGPE